METFSRAGLTFDVRDHRPPQAPGTPAAPGPAAPDAARADPPTAVLLHGFPQNGSAYDAVIPLLVAGGMRVLVPDQRGYSPGARPRGRRAYTVPELVEDVVALLDAAQVERAHVVGHDWGGSVAWTFAGRRPERTLSLTALSTPHPAAMAAALRHRDQARRSRYMLGFQLPWLPEARLLARDGARLRSSLVRSGLSEASADRYVQRMREPGALTAALAWYRALPVTRGGGAGRTRVPTTYLTGRRDPFFAPDAVAGTAAFVTGPFEHRELDADHWLPEHRASEVATAVLERAARATRPD